MTPDLFQVYSKLWRAQLRGAIKDVRATDPDSLVHYKSREGLCKVSILARRRRAHESLEIGKEDGGIVLGRCDVGVIVRGVPYQDSFSLLDYDRNSHEILVKFGSEINRAGESNLRYKLEDEVNNIARSQYVSNTCRLLRCNTSFVPEVVGVINSYMRTLMVK